MLPLEKGELAKALGELRKGLKKRKFAQSIELIVKLRDIDIKNPENRINESIRLPNPPGKTGKVCVLASGDLATRSKSAGADVLLSRDDIEALGRNKKEARKLARDCDAFIAEASLMPLVGRALGPFLGPRGKMPTPVPPNVAIDQAIADHRRMVRLRMREHPVLACRIGSESMPDDNIVENVETVMGRLEQKLARGTSNIAQVLLKATMSEPVKVTVSR